MPLQVSSGEETHAAPVLVYPELDSTNAEARRRAEAGETGPLWIMAVRQSAGRGRRGRAWETGPGNLAATLLTTTSKPPVEAAQIAFVAALAVADLAASQVPESLVRLKWPNDVLVGDSKVSGVLVESGPARDGRLWLAVGVGVNLLSAPVAAHRPATTLKHHLRLDVEAPLAAPAALDGLASAFQRRLLAWERLGFAGVRDAWSARAYGLGQVCEARLDQETVRGVAEGLDPDGALRLRLADGTVRRITAGDVFFGEAP